MISIPWSTEFTTFSFPTSTWHGTVVSKLKAALH
ncbi:hypothetical protein T03_9584 [Trichinella britovi]|uniref:Uncharacterized protein n=1 Tax=Trichinella britovi TaxID=45882 RepID=A0A0V0YSS0_TRIBR|nr:hypothetical protein T03_9584 [Trichinella britovi]